MALAVGTKLGPYEVQRQIGAGGMGEVYGATDPRLGRAVAIKVLPPELRAHADRLRRFEQEARTIGALNHPNLLTLHDVGQHDGAPYLVTELLDGRSLRARLASGPVSLREVVRIAREVARGLAAAHAAGVVHRDIKPDNLFVTADDRVKILDFGIAKLRDQRTDSGDRSEVELGATLAATLGTGTGAVIGTPGYMAPEQLAGKPVDARTDIFALGVVIYELIAGRRPFVGESAIEEGYAILKADPPPLPVTVPPTLDRIVMRCLEKRADARFQSASDLAFALDAIDSISAAIQLPLDALLSGPTITAPHSAATPTGAATTKRVRTVRRWPAIAAMLALAAAGATGWALYATQRPASPRWPDRVAGGPSFHRVTFHARDQWFARFSKDAKYVYYSVRTDKSDDWRVFRSEVARPSVESVKPPGRVLAISANSDELALSTPWHQGAGGVLSRAFSNETVPRRLADGIANAAWGPDGEKLAATRLGDSGASLEFPLGTTIVKPQPGTIPYLAISQDGQRIAFCEVPGGREARARIVIVDVHGTQLAVSPWHAEIRGLAWSPYGREVWFSTTAIEDAGNAIRAVASDDGRERVLLRTAGAVTLFDVARDGRMLVAIGDARTHMMIGQRGEPLADVAWFDAVHVQSISADGKIVAFVEATGTAQTAEGHAAYLRTADQDPVLIGHGSRLALIPDRAGTAAVIEMVGDALERVSVEHSATATPLPLGPIVKLDPSDRMAVAWSGNFLVVRGAAAGKQMRLWLWDLAAGTDPRPIGPPINATGYHPVSSDGRWIALALSTGGVQLVSTAGDERRVIAPREPGELAEPLSFTADGTALLVMAAHHYPRKVYRIVIDGTAPASDPIWLPWVDLDIPGKPTLFEPAFSANGEDLAYSYTTELSDLYVLEPPSRAP